MRRYRCQTENAHSKTHRRMTRRARRRMFRQSSHRGARCVQSAPTAGDSSPGHRMDDSLAEFEADEVARYYPLSLGKPFETGNWIFAWEVRMNPIPRPEELDAVLSDLQAGFEVDIGPHGRICHSTRECGQRLHDHSAEMPRVVVPDRPYLVELAYPRVPNGPSGPVHPKARVIEPEISIRTYPMHPHLSSSASGDSWSCPLSPHDTSWRWQKGATWLYLAHVALWILKTEIWARTGGGVGALGRWIGEADPHTPNHVLSTVSVEGPCRCGRGVVYRDCHLGGDLAAGCGALGPASSLP